METLIVQEGQTWPDKSKRGNGRKLLVCFMDTHINKVDVVNMETAIGSVLDISRFGKKTMALKSER